MGNVSSLAKKNSLQTPSTSHKIIPYKNTPLTDSSKSDHPSLSKSTLSTFYAPTAAGIKNNDPIESSILSIPNPTVTPNIMDTTTPAIQEDSWTDLMRAIRCGKSDQSLDSLLLRSDLNATLSDGSTALILAARFNQPDMVGALMQHNADVNIVDNDGWTALMHASSYGYTDIAIELLAHNADFEIADPEGWTALTLASRYGRTPIIKALLTNVLNVNEKTLMSRTPLTLASRYGYITAVRELIQYGADLEAVEQEGNTALLLAVLGCHREIVQELLHHGAQLEHADASGSTAITLAILHKHSAILHDLLLQGTSCNIHTLSGATLLYKTAQHDNRCAVTIIEHSTEYSITSIKGAVVFLWAVKNGDKKILTALIAQHIHLHMSFYDDKTLIRSSKKETIAVIWREAKHDPNLFTTNTSMLLTHIFTPHNALTLAHERSAVYPLRNQKYLRSILNLTDALIEEGLEKERLTEDKNELKNYFSLFNDLSKPPKKQPIYALPLKMDAYYKTNNLPGTL